jgi:hypothetical protein
VRRSASVVLFVLCGWMLSAGVMMGWVDLDEGLGMQLVMAGIVCLFSLPFLLLAVWASPGNRWREAGLTILIAAGLGGAMALMLILVMNDPSFIQLMPPEQAMPHLKFVPLSGIVTVLLFGGIGWLLYRQRVNDRVG